MKGLELEMNMSGTSEPGIILEPQQLRTITDGGWSWGSKGNIQMVC